jgi:hypothetical protein
MYTENSNQENPLLGELGIEPDTNFASEIGLEETVSALQNAVPPSQNQNIPAHSIIKTVVDEYAKEVFDSPQQARSFITNKLLELSTCGDPRHELRALELLGKLSDISAFTEKSEVVVTAKSSADIDRQIKEKLGQILEKRGVSLEKVIEAEVIELRPTQTDTEPDELDEVIAQRRQKDSKSVLKTEEEDDESV